MRSRRKIIDATRGLIGTKGFGAVSIAAAAEHAGVSRQTVYSIFGSREELVSQTVADHLSSLVERFRTVLAETASPVAYVVELIVECRRAFREDAVFIGLLRVSDGNPVFDPGAVDRACAVAVELLEPMRARFPEVGDRVEEIAEICVHLGWATVCLDDPKARTDDDLRRFLGRWLGPALGEPHRLA